MTQFKKQNHTSACWRIKRYFLCLGWQDFLISNCLSQAQLSLRFFHEAHLMAAIIFHLCNLVFRLEFFQLTMRIPCETFLVQKSTVKFFLHSTQMTFRNFSQRFLFFQSGKLSKILSQKGLKKFRNGLFTKRKFVGDRPRVTAVVSATISNVKRGVSGRCTKNDQKKISICHLEVDDVSEKKFCSETIQRQK